jgi:hypothetical protein
LESDDSEETLGDLFFEDDSQLVEVNVSQLDRLAEIDASQFGFFETP